MTGWDEGFSISEVPKIYSILVIASQRFTLPSPYAGGITSEELSFRNYEEAEAAYLQLKNYVFNSSHSLDFVRLYPMEKKEEEEQLKPNQ